MRKKGDAFFRDKRGKKPRKVSFNLTLFVVVVAVLVIFHVVSFTVGWRNAFSLLVGEGNSNIKSLRLECNLACVEEDASAYCDSERWVRDGINEDMKSTCYGKSTKCALHLASLW